jgi:hypothetical protein
VRSCRSLLTSCLVRTSLTVLLLFLMANGAAAQVSGAVAAGAGTVRYGGGTSASLATLSPSLIWSTPGTAGWVTGTAALLPNSAWAFQGNGDLTLTSGVIAGRWRLGGELTGGVTTVTGGDRTGALGALGEWSLRGAGWGVAAGAGTTAGWIAGTAGATALRLRMRAWWLRDDFRLTASVEPTRFLGAWFTDFTAGAMLHRGSLGVAATIMARASQGWGSAAAGSVVADLAVSPRVGIEVAGGSALADVYQGFPRTGFASAGVRVFFPTRSSSGPISEARAALANRDGDDFVTVTFHIVADSVAVAGDWNGWTPEPLEQVAPDLWRLRKHLAPGIYRFGLVLGPGQWTVPQGYPTVPDDWGGMAAVLVVQ